MRSILCPVDFSEPSREALRWAGMLARRMKARLTVLSAVEPLLAEAAQLQLGRDLVRETEPELREFAAATWSQKTAAALDARFAVQVGPAADAILRTAVTESADLIVIGTHGLGGVRKWLLGSTTERVLRRAHTPVFTVPPSASGMLRSDATTTPLALGPVLAATDFSDASRRAIGWAADLAREFASQLCLVHVVEAVAAAPRWQSYLAYADDARVVEAGPQLQTLAQQVASRVDVDSVVVRGHAADAIAGVADERRASMIVMGLAGRDSAAGSRPGSIAYRVLCLAKVPVLVVQPQAADPLGDLTQP